MLTPQLVLDVNEEIFVDGFAGGGGASTGIEQALGRPPDAAFNHDKYALGMHRINHPQTVHHLCDIFEADPVKVANGRRVGAGWFSPDCTFHSKARGGKPVTKRIRALALIIFRWAAIRTRVIYMENVEELKKWCPLKRMKKNGKWGMFPDPELTGRTWQAFIDVLGPGIPEDHPDIPEFLEILNAKPNHKGIAPLPTVTKEHLVRGYGYQVEHREIRAYTAGAPTIRNRLYMIARCDGLPIVWPADTNAKPENVTKGIKPWRIIAECIDWDIPCNSIFLTRKQAKKFRCRRPLAKSTLQRIATGVGRHVIHAKKPFLVNTTHGVRLEQIDEPIKTITGAHRGEKSVVNVETTAPFINEHANASNQRTMPGDEPARTICSEPKGGSFALVGASMIQKGHYKSNSKMVKAVDEPMRCQTTAAEHGVVAASLVREFGQSVGQPPDAPAPTVMPHGQGKTGLVTANLVRTSHGEKDKSGKKRGRGDHAVTESLPTATASPEFALVSGTLVETGYGERDGQQPRAPGIDKPLGTAVAGGGKHAVVATNLVKLRGDAKTHSAGAPMDEPCHTASAGGLHHGLVAAHLTKFTTGSTGQAMDKPGPTTTAGSHSPDTHGGAASTQGVVSAYLAQHNGGFNTTPGHEATKPISTVSAKGSQQQVVACATTAFYGSEADGQSLDEAMRTATTKARFAMTQAEGVAPPMTPEQIQGARRVAAFLRKYGVEFEGEFATVSGYVIVDIGMRMLTPRELFRAQGFPESYIIDRAWVVDPRTRKTKEVKLTKEQQIRMCGNSVCPPVAANLVAANSYDMAVWKGADRKVFQKKLKHLHSRITAMAA